MADLAELFSGEAEVEVDIGSEGVPRKVKVRYCPAKVTYRFRSQFQKAVNNPRDGTFNEALAEIVTGWDLTNKGKPYAVTPANIAALPDQFVVSACLAIFEDLNAPEASAATAESS